MWRILETRAQRIVFGIGLLVFVLMGLNAPESYQRYGSPSVDLARLLVLWAVDIVATAGILLLLKLPSPPPNQQGQKPPDD